MDALKTYCTRSVPVSCKLVTNVSDPDSPGFVWIWLSWIRIWIRIGDADSDPGAKNVRNYIGTIYHILDIFHVKIQLLVMTKSDQDPDPDWFGSPDPDPH